MRHTHPERRPSSQGASMKIEREESLSMSHAVEKLA
jgi:hypothetical protein